MDQLTKKQRSWNMSRIHASGTKFERRIFKELQKRGVNFQKNYSKVIGKPDIALPRKKKAVFLHSDFWHGWQLSRWEKILPNNFWKQKLRKNKTRDRKVLRLLRGMGWKVIIIWEHSFHKNPKSFIGKLIKFLK